MPKGIPLTDDEQNRRRHQIFDTAVALFLEKGFQEISMQELARSLGMGKSTLYDYFPSKDEILISFVEDAIYDLTELARQIANQDLPAADKLRQVLRAHYEFLVANKAFYSRLTFEIQRLALASRERIQQKRHAYQDLLCQLVEAAVREGAFRPVSSLLAARALLALLTPAVYTSRPTGTSEQMLEEVLDIFYYGVSQ
jgi:TetR/AcrR family transcriptional regulator, cholesterol catabolism regulator